MADLTMQSLSRRVKRHFYAASRHNFFVSCLPGFEDVLHKELSRLETVGQQDGLRFFRGGIEFTASLDAVYEAHLFLFSATRVLLRVANFPATSTSELFDRISRIKWELYVGVSPRVQVVVSTRSSVLNHRRKVAEVVENGVYSRLKRMGLSQTSLAEKANALTELRIKIHRNYCVISMNTSGTHLHKRGWRKSATRAPIRETTASSVLLKLGAAEKDFVCDPFAGSGTFLIEAARQASGLPPSTDRNFLFMEAPFFRKGKWEHFRRKQRSLQGGVKAKYTGLDIDSTACSIAKANAAQARVQELLEFRVADALQFEYQKAARGFSKPLLVANLPYGKRLGFQAGTEATTHAFFERISSECLGWDVGIICPARHEASEISLTNKVVTPFQNGGLSVVLISGRIDNK